MDKVSALFSEVWHAGQPLLNQDDILCDFFKKQSEELALAATQSFISVGPGTGTVERGIIKYLMPKLRKFIAVEPTPEVLQTLKDNFICFEHIELDYQNHTIQEFEGPNEQVQLILCCHSLYYVADDLENQLRRCLQWLSPGGAMVIVHATEDGTNMMSEFRKELTWTTIGIGSNVIEEALKRISVRYEEHILPYCIDVSSAAGRDFIYFLHLNRPCTDKERKVLENILRKYCNPEREPLNQPVSVFIVKKE